MEHWVSSRIIIKELLSLPCLTLKAQSPHYFHEQSSMHDKQVERLWKNIPWRGNLPRPGHSIFGFSSATTSVWSVFRKRRSKILSKVRLVVFESLSQISVEWEGNLLSHVLLSSIINKWIKILLDHKVYCPKSRKTNLWGWWGGGRDAALYYQGKSVASPNWFRRLDWQWYPVGTDWSHKKSIHFKKKMFISFQLLPLYKSQL